MTSNPMASNIYSNREASFHRMLRWGSGIRVFTVQREGSRGGARR